MVGEIGDVLGRDGVQPRPTIRACQRDDTAMRPIDDNGVGERRTLLAEWVAVMPCGTGIWALKWGGDGFHAFNSTVARYGDAHASCRHARR